MYIAPNTSLLKKILLASTAGLFLLVGVSFWLGKEQPVVEKPMPVVVPIVAEPIPEPPVVKEPQDQTYLFGERAPLAITLSKEFSVSAVTTPDVTTLYVSHDGEKIATLARAREKKLLEVLIDTHVAVASDTVIDVSGIAYIRQQIIPLAENQASIRVIPGSKCKSSSTCPLFVATLDQETTPESLALFEKILGSVIWLEQPQGWKQYTLQTSDRAVHYAIAPGATKANVDGVIQVSEGEIVIATITPVDRIDLFPISEDSRAVWTVNGEERVVLQVSGQQETYVPLSKDRGLKIVASSINGLITLLSLK